MGRRLGAVTKLGAQAWRGFWRARSAHRRGLPGEKFDRLGRWFGLRAICRLGGKGPAMDLLSHPLTGPRYFEFDFALTALPDGAGSYLDLSSPRLFSLFVAQQRPGARVVMANPDAGDAAASELLCRGLGLDNITIRNEGVAEARQRNETFDCIWAISVIEHIDGSYDDRQAIQWMWEMLKPGGRLILTFPVDRNHWIEYRKDDPYGEQTAVPGKGYFYQRYYNPASVQERLLSNLPGRPASFAWYGETVGGWINSTYEPYRRSGNEAYLSEDAGLMADNCRRFGSWEEMPGAGVCGLSVSKPG